MGQLISGINGNEPPHDKTNKMACVPSKDSDQPSLIRVFAVCMKKAWVLSYPLSTQRRLWSDWADAQADLSLLWAHMPFCWFCHEAAQMSLCHGHYCIACLGRIGYLHSCCLCCWESVTLVFCRLVSKGLGLGQEKQNSCMFFHFQPARPFLKPSNTNSFW